MTTCPMTVTSFKKKFKLVQKWDYQCVVCGRAFENLACVTVEHVMPKSIVGNKNKHSNQAPSHWRCNAIKGDLSLMETAAYMEFRAIKMGEEKFCSWLSTMVPGRDVPWYALIPLVDAEWFLF